MNSMTPPTELNTPHGAIRFPTYVPVTTFGTKFPLDELVRPYLTRLASAVMISYYYAQQMDERPLLPLLIDSGGFGSLFENARVNDIGGLGVLEIATGETTEVSHPADVLDFQERNADVAFTLDFPIPPSMHKSEARRRKKLTIANALWALENRRRKDLLLYGCVQGWDLGSYRDCAEAYAGRGFDGIAIGGLVPRVSDLEGTLRIVDAVRTTIPDAPLHVFGIGKPDTVAALFQHGVQSVDSSSYVKLAAEGKLWGQPSLHLVDASPSERLHLALCNLAMATQRTLPLSAAHLMFGSPIFERTDRPGANIPKAASSAL